MTRARRPRPAGGAIEGSRREPVAGYVRSGTPVDLTAEKDVTVVVRPRTALPSDEETFARGALPLRERKHMTLAEWTAKHGADERDLAAVQAYAAKHDLGVYESDFGVARRRVSLHGRVADLNRAFGTELAYFAPESGDGDEYLGRTGSLSVGPEVAPAITAVLGLDERPWRRAPKDAPAGTADMLWPAAVKAHSPPEVAAMYNFPTRLDGRGQTIAVIAAHDGGYSLKDMEPFFAGLDLPTPRFTDVPVNGWGNSFVEPHGTPGSEDGEVALDLQVIGAIVPAAELVVYFSQLDNRGYVDALSKAVFHEQYRPSVISTSYGSPEDAFTDQARAALDEVLRAAAWLGITVTTASGDYGYSDLRGLTDVVVAGVRATVDYPASSPFVLACGGTTLKRSDGGIHEAVWGGTGGGVSECYPVPSWQQKADVPRSANPPHFAGRGVPDVAGLADGDVGYRTHWGGRQRVQGGTSAVAPLWAALVAQLNQSLAATDGFPDRAGYLNPLLYEQVAPAGFNSIVNGANGLYDAGLGWDACTGHGSPDGMRLIEALKR